MGQGEEKLLKTNLTRYYCTLTLILDSLFSLFFMSSSNRRFIDPSSLCLLFLMIWIPGLRPRIKGSGIPKLGLRRSFYQAYVPFDPPSHLRAVRAFDQLPISIGAVQFHVHDRRSARSKPDPFLTSSSFQPVRPSLDGLSFLCFMEERPFLNGAFPLLIHLKSSLFRTCNNYNLCIIIQ